MEAKKQDVLPDGGTGQHGNATTTKDTPATTTRGASSPTKDQAPTTSGGRYELPTSVPTFRLGSRTLALDVALKSGRPVATVREVVAVADGLSVVGWRGVFRGMYLSGPADDIAAFASELAKRLRRKAD